MDKSDLFDKFYKEGNYPDAENNSDTMPEMTIEEFKWNFMQVAFQAGLNNQQKKTFSQMMTESINIEAIEKEQALESMKVGKMSIGEHKGTTSSIVAPKIGMKARTYEKAKKIWTERDKNPIADEIIKKIDLGKMSINAGYVKLNNIKK